MRRCINANKEAFSFAYFLITEIHTNWSYGDGRALDSYQELEKATAASWKSMFYVHYNFHAREYCDDWWCILA